MNLFDIRVFDKGSLKELLSRRSVAYVRTNEELNDLLIESLLYSESLEARIEGLEEQLQALGDQVKFNAVF